MIFKVFFVNSVEFFFVFEEAFYFFWKEIIQIESSLILKDTEFFRIEGKCGKKTILLNFYEIYDLGRRLELLSENHELQNPSLGFIPRDRFLSNYEQTKKQILYDLNIIECTYFSNFMSSLIN